MAFTKLSTSFASRLSSTFPTHLLPAGTKTKRRCSALWSITSWWFPNRSRLRTPILDAGSSRLAANERVPPAATHTGVGSRATVEKVPSPPTVKEVVPSPASQYLVSRRALNRVVERSPDHLLDADSDVIGLPGGAAEDLEHRVHFNRASDVRIV